MRRLGWGLADQILSSLSNFALGVAVATSVAPAAFGAFGVAFAVYLVALGATRAVASEPLMVRFSSPSGEWARGAQAATGLALAVGLPAGVGLVAVGIAVGEPLGAALIPLGIFLPVLLLEDAWRCAFLALRKPHLAFAVDLVWAVVLFGAMAPVLALRAGSVARFVVLWGCGALAAALAGRVMAGVSPSMRPLGWWIRSQADLGPRFLGEFVARNGTQSFTLFAVAAFGGLAEAAAIRGGHLLLGPANIVNMGLTSASVPEAVGWSKHSQDRLARRSFFLSVAIAGSTLLWGGALLLVPEATGKALLGDSWAGSRQMVVPLTLALAAAGFQTGPTVGMRAMAAARESLLARVITAGMALFLGVGGATVGAAAAAWGLAAGLWLGAAVWWWIYRSVLGSHPRSPADPDELAQVATQRGAA